MKKPAERLKVQNILDKIKTDKFSSEDIDLLLIKLREYALPKSLFEEISHFAAHNESRNKGISFKRLSGYFDTMYYHMSHTFDGGTPLDFSKPIPAYVINTINFNLSLLGNDFQESYKCSLTQFNSQFNNVFEKIKGTDTYKIKGTLKGVVKTVTQDMLSVLISKPLCDGKEILNEIFLLLQSNNFSITFNELNLRYEKIIIFIIYLMHNTEYKISESVKGYSQISISQDKNSTIELDCVIPSTNKNIDFCFPLISTGISSHLFCSDNLLKKKIQHPSQLIINKKGELDILPPI